MNDLLQQANEILGQVSGSMEKLMNIQKQIFDSLDQEQLKDVSGTINDIEEAKKALKDGDSSKINALLKKYADINK